MKAYYLGALLLVFGLSIVFLDFLSKIYAFYSIPIIEPHHFSYPYGGIGIFNNFYGIECSLGLVMNKGAAWGLFSNFQTPLIVIRILVIFGLLTYLIFFNQNRLAQIPLILIIGGAFGNIADFFIYGSVIDFIHFKFWGYDFPVFNLADTFITLGVFYLFLIGTFANKGSKQMEKSSK